MSGRITAADWIDRALAAGFDLTLTRDPWTREPVTICVGRGRARFGDGAWEELNVLLEDVGLGAVVAEMARREAEARVIRHGRAA